MQNAKCKMNALSKGDEKILSFAALSQNRKCKELLKFCILHFVFCIPKEFSGRSSLCAIFFGSPRRSR